MKIGTLFSGIGAPEFAMESANIKHTIAYACDNDPHVKRTYLANHRPEIWYDDVTDITNPPEVDLLMFGFPCQPFSLAGHRNGLKDARGRLVWSAIKMLGKSRPKMIIAENVEGLVRHDNGRTLPIILKSMRGYGYHVQWQLLNSLHFGLPQNRNRIWIVGVRKDYEFPVGEKSHIPLKDLLDKNAPQDVFATEDFLAKPKVQKRLADYTKDYMNCITMATVCRGGSSSEYISAVAAINRAIGQTRKPTVQECLRLFGFPEGFKFPDEVCKTRRYAMLANSMAVPVVRNVIENLM